jgi:hypothetical protein
MDVGCLVMATHGVDIEGFLALLNEVMWRANYTYRPKYVVYGIGVRHGMVDYMAKVHVLSRLCDPGEEVERDAWGKGTSINMAIQVVGKSSISSASRPSNTSRKGQR